MARKMQTKGFDQKIIIKSKDDAPEGTFVAYGNVFGVKDNAGDITVKGCFSNTIKKHKSEGTMPRLLAQHGHRMMPIGIITDMIEDEKGLRFEGQFCLETQAGSEAHALCKMGAIDQFSIGYVTLDQEMTTKGNLLKELDVAEISLVTFACNEHSTLVDVKSAVENEELTPRLLQKAIRDAFGLSKRQSEAAINAIKSTEREEVEEESTEVKELGLDEAFRVKMSEAPELTKFSDGLEVKSLGDKSFQQVLSGIKSALVEPIGHWDFYLDDVFESKGYVEFCDYRARKYKHAEFEWMMDDMGEVQVTSFKTGTKEYGTTFVVDAEDGVKNNVDDIESKHEDEETVESLAAKLLGVDFETKEESDVENNTKADDIDLETIDLSELLK